MWSKRFSSKLLPKLQIVPVGENVYKEKIFYAFQILTYVGIEFQELFGPHMQENPQ